MHQEDKEARGLSIVARYTITAIILALVTCVEVLVLYPPLARAGENFKILLLCTLGIGKFILVVALFMHLYDDSPLLTGIFGLGMLLGGGTLVGLVAVMSVYPLRPDAVKAPSLQQIHEDRMRTHSEGADSTAEQHSFVTPLQLAGVRSV